MERSPGLGKERPDSNFFRSAWYIEYFFKTFWTKISIFHPTQRVRDRILLARWGDFGQQGAFRLRDADSLSKQIPKTSVFPCCQVYDITNWHILHPGGSSLLLKYAGRDATAASSLPAGRGGIGITVIAGRKNNNSIQISTPFSDAGPKTFHWWCFSATHLIVSCTDFEGSWERVETDGSVEAARTQPMGGSIGRLIETTIDFIWECSSVTSARGLGLIARWFTLFNNLNWNNELMSPRIWSGSHQSISKCNQGSTLSMAPMCGFDSAASF